MAISDEERRIFEELSMDIERNDPAFVRRMSSASVNVRGTILNVMILIAGIILLLSGVSMNNLLVGIVGFCVMCYSGFRACSGKGVRVNTKDDETGIGPGLRV